MAPALKEQKEFKRYMAKGSDGRELQAVVRLGGEYVGAREDEVHEYVRMIKEATGIPLMGDASARVEEAYQWMLLRDARDGWRGDVLVKVGTKAEVLHMFAALEAIGVLPPFRKFVHKLYAHNLQVV